MICIPQSLSVLFIALCVNLACAADLELAIEAHSRQVTFGDPLYLKIMLRNAGPVATESPPFEVDLNTVGIKIDDRASEISTHGDLSTGGGLMGPLRPVRMEPGESKTIYGTIFLPSFRRKEFVFWTRFRKGGSLDVSAKYSLGDFTTLSCNHSVDIVINRRDEKEMEEINSWPQTKTDETRGPSAQMFRLPFRCAPSYERTLEFIDYVGPGEIQDLLILTSKVQKCYLAPEDSRQIPNAELVEWLDKQVRIKREALAESAATVARVHRMDSTVEALERIMQELPRTKR